MGADVQQRLGDGAGQGSVSRVTSPMQFDGSLVCYPQTSPTYGATVTLDLTQGSHFTITATNNTAFTISNPTGRTPRNGERLWITVRNTSGGALGAITFGAQFKVAFTSPATGFSRSIECAWNGTNWVEVSATPADIPN